MTYGFADPLMGVTLPLTSTLSVLANCRPDPSRPCSTVLWSTRQSWRRTVEYGLSPSVSHGQLAFEHWIVWSWIHMFEVSPTPAAPMATARALIVVLRISTSFT